MPDPVVTTTVAVRDLAVEALIGINPDEKDRLQPLKVTVEAVIDRKRPPSGIDETLDYCAVAAAARTLASRHIGLIEEYARLLGERCLALAPVSRVQVTVSKPSALDGGEAVTIVVMEPPRGAEIVPFPRADPSAGGPQTLRFAFKRTINPDAQQVLANFLGRFVLSLDGVSRCHVTRDPRTLDWVAQFSGPGTRALELDEDPFAMPGQTSSSMAGQ